MPNNQGVNQIDKRVSIERMLKVGAVMFLGSLLAGCFGLPVETRVYKETLGPKQAGCLNRHGVVINKQGCSDYLVGELVVEVAIRGSKQYYQDPESSPYKISAVVCDHSGEGDFDFEKDLNIDQISITTNSGQSWDDLQWELLNFNKNCRFIAFTPWLELDVELQNRLDVQLDLSLKAYDGQSYSLFYSFQGDEYWMLPFYGP